MRTSCLRREIGPSVFRLGKLLDVYGDAIADAVPSTRRDAALHEHAVNGDPGGPAPQGPGPDGRPRRACQLAIAARLLPTDLQRACLKPPHLLPSALQRTARFTATGRAT